jgi:sugar phosphate isomerase/epimerase
MVQFGTGYFNPMDRDYDSHDHSHNHEKSEKELKSTGDVGIGIGDLGMSLGLGPVPNVSAVAAKLRPGIKNLEFVFMGTGKGSGQGQTPGMYGEKQRQAFREIGKANKVNFTTHSTVGIYGLSGMDQQGNFSKASKNHSLDELKRAIKFAADVGRGGPVVVHSGEFSRPIVDSAWNQKDDGYKGQFEMFDDEEGKTSYKVVDSRHGNLIAEARKNRDVSRPVWLTAYQDDRNKGIVKGDYVDYEGNKISRAKRVPKWDKEKQEFEIKQYGWKDLEQDSRDMTGEAKDEWRRWKKSGKNERENIKNKSPWARFMNTWVKEENIEVKPEEAYIIANLETSAANARGWSLQYSGNFDELIKKKKELDESLKFYEELESKTPQEERWKLMRKVGEGDLLPGEEMMPSKIIEKKLRNLNNDIKRSQEAASGQLSQAAESVETMKHVESAETYALREACNAYAESAIVAWRKTKELEKTKDLKRPLSIALENLFPEHYGSHPDEIMKLVRQSRSSMQKMLQEKYHRSEEEAKKLSEQHITTTFDTGHLNMWRKYWKTDPNKTIQENDKEFDQWMLSKVEDMVKKKMIGHVHIDDNYGYHDDHLAPGEGNTPIKKMLKILKDNGYKGELIVEPGADYTTDVSGFHSVMKTWKDLDLSVYGKGSGLAPKTWGGVGYGHFGQNQPPYFVIGSYVPSEDFTLWSGVPFD